MKPPRATLAMAKHMKLIHPFLFAATLILFVYSRGKGQIPSGDLIRPLIVATAFVLVLSVIAIWVTASFLKGTLVASAGVISLVVAEAVASQLTSSRGGDSVSFIVMISLSAAVAGFLIGVIVLLRKTSQDMTALTDLVAVSAFALFTFNIVSLALSWPASPEMLPLHANLQMRSVPTHRPDIFYLVLDGYARDDVLREVYAHDNSSFIDFLETNGFYLANGSRANYVPTFQSLASTLNMDYLDKLLEPFNRNSNDREPLRRLISHSTSSRFLRSLGYKFITFQTGVATTDVQNSDHYVVGRVGLNEFETALLLLTPLGRLSDWFQVDRFELHRQRQLNILDYLEAMPAEDSPVLFLPTSWRVILPSCSTKKAGE